MPINKNDYLDKDSFGIILIGPSGSGKTSLRDGLLSYGFKEFKLAQYKPYTSRAQRPKENDEYFFVDDKTLDEIEKTQKILFRNEYHGNKFLTTWPHKLGQNEYYIYIYSPDGAAKIKAAFPKHKIIQIVPDGSIDISSVLLKRDPNISEDELKRRLEIIPTEIEKGGKVADYIFNNKSGINESVDSLALIIEKMHSNLS